MKVLLLQVRYLPTDRGVVATGDALVFFLRRLLGAIFELRLRMLLFDGLVVAPAAARFKERQSALRFEK